VTHAPIRIAAGFRSLGPTLPQKASLSGGCTLNLINHVIPLSPDNVGLFLTISPSHIVSRDLFESALGQPGSDTNLPLTQPPDRLAFWGECWPKRPKARCYTCGRVCRGPTAWVGAPFVRAAPTDTPCVGGPVPTALQACAINILWDMHFAAYKLLLPAKAYMHRSVIRLSSASISSSLHLSSSRALANSNLDINGFWCRRPG
jgi:hypothetical protein